MTVDKLYSNINIKPVKIRASQQTGEVMIEILPKDLNKIDALKKISGIKSIYVNKNGRRKLVYGSPVIYDKIGRFKFQISPDTPKNNLDEEKLEEVKKKASIQIGDNVLVLNCGTGVIPIYLSTLAKRIVGIDPNPIAIRDAKDNAKVNHCLNLEFICANPKKIDLQQYSNWIVINKSDIL